MKKTSCATFSGFKTITLLDTNEAICEAKP